jgi:hypothetical protein
MRAIRTPLAAATAVALLVGLTGCADKTTRQVSAMNTSNIQRVSNLYSAYQNYKAGQGPKDEADFKAFVKAFDPNNLSMMGVDPNNVEAVFTSERDGKPFKIRYKVGDGRGSVSAVVFEQEGKDGKKQVGFTGNSKVEDVDDATYQQLWAGKGPSEPPAAAPVSKTGPGGRPSGPPPGAPTGPPK